MAILVDACSFLASVLSLWLIHTPEQSALLTASTRTSLWREISEGLQALWRTPVLRDMTIFTTIGAFFGTIQQTMFVLFVIDDLKLTAFQLGLVVSCSGAADFLGALLVSSLARRLGPGLDQDQPSFSVCFSPAWVGFCSRLQQDRSSWRSFYSSADKSFLVLEGHCIV
jgi:hypothetical protein